MIASTIEFFTPFITVMYFNLSIYLNIRKRSSLRNENLSPGQEDCEISLQGEKRERTIFFVKPANRHKHEKKRASSLSPPKKASRLSLHKLDNQSLNLHINQDLPPLQVEVKTKPHRNCFYKTTESICNTTIKVDIANTMANRFRLSRDKRVAKSLAIIVCVFGLCWAPYTLLMIIRAACHGHCVQYSLYETSFWLLWVNSAINPVLYPPCHMSFRKAFIKLLCPRKAKIHPHIFMWMKKYEGWQLVHLAFSGSINWLTRLQIKWNVHWVVYGILISRYKRRYLWMYRNTVIHVAGEWHQSKKVVSQSSLGSYASSMFSGDGALAFKCWRGNTIFMANNWSSGSYF